MLRHARGSRGGSVDDLMANTATATTTTMTTANAEPERKVP